MHTRFEKLIERYPELAACSESLELALEQISGSFRKGGKLLLAGNGGSASDADHISGELLKGFEHRRSLEAGERERVGDVFADKLAGALPAIPLSQLTAIRTAWTNDEDGDYTDAQLLYGLGREGDVLLVLSTSGNSVNMVHACALARRLGIYSIALTGRSGGKLREIADLCVHVPSDCTPDIQERHLPIYHALCLALEDIFFSPPGN